MAIWRVEIVGAARRDLDRLDPQITRRIERFLFERLAPLDNPRSIGEALRGPRFGELWKYRVGDWRILCKIQDEALIVLTLQVGHRRDVYER